MNEFHKDNGYSLDPADEAFWFSVYRRAFPDMLTAELCTDIKQQKCGIDRYIFLNNGECIRIDEKKRRGKWDDVLLEFVSNDQSNTPGWIKKPLTIDYLAYAFMPQRRVYFFPWMLLRRTWLHFGDTWIKYGYAKQNGFTIVTANNPTYNTISVAVPLETLRAALSVAGVIDITKG